MIAEIISIGTELLLGDVVNTNASYFGKELSKIGIDLYYITVVGDNINRILSAFEIASNRADIIITSGGIGPTSDDLTHEVIAKFFNLELVLYKEIEDELKKRFEKRGIKELGSNIKQAYLPKGSEIINNNNGTAPGIILKNNNKIFITFPGVPYELKAMWEETARNYLFSINNYKDRIYSRVLKFIGIRESLLGEIVEDLMNLENPKIGILAKDGGIILLRLTTKAIDEEMAEKIIKPIEDEILKRAGNYYFCKDDEDLENIILNSLKKNNITNINILDFYSNNEIFKNLIRKSNSNIDNLAENSVSIKISNKDENSDISFSIEYNNKIFSKKINYLYFQEKNNININLLNQVLNNLRLILEDNNESNTNF